MGLSETTHKPDGYPMSDSEFFLGPRRLGDGEPCYVIAEIGSNFNVSLDLAKQSIDAAVDAGADAVKFQTFKADEFVAGTELSYSYRLLDGSVVTESQHEMFKKLELPNAWHADLYNYAQSKGVDFLSSAADRSAVDLLCDIGVPAIKLASEDLINIELLKYVATKGRPLLLSTGMADEGEIKIAIENIKEYGDPPVMLMHCTSVYPTPPHACNLRRIQTLRDRFQHPVGFSDHTMGWEAPHAAVALGAIVIEKHFTLDRMLPGPDHQMSTEPEEFSIMVSKIRELEVLLGSDRIDYDPIEEEGRLKFRRSIVAAYDLEPGVPLVKSDFSYKRPGHGLKPYEQNLLLGKLLRKAVGKDQIITLEDVS